MKTLKQKSDKLQKRREKAERKRRKTDKGAKYEIRFNAADVESFYEDRAVLPAAAIWNMDEFLFAYIAAGLDGLLNGATDWDHWDAAWGKPNLHKSTRKKLKRARNLARAYVDAHVKMAETEESMEGAHECLRLLTEIGVGRLWD